MAKPHPKKREHSRSALRFDFNAAAQQARREYPALRKHAMFIDASNDNWRDIEYTLDHLAVDEEDIESVHKTFNDARRLKTSFHLAVTRGGEEEPFSAVVFHPDRHPLYGTARGAVDDAATFDHETGHALTPELHGNPAENVADAYASLKHLQRSGGEADSLDYCSWKRALVFVTTGIPTHLTTFTVDKILCDRKTADFMSLTPAETAAIAIEYAKHNAPSKKELSALAKDFKPLKNLPLKDAFRKLAQITFAAEDDSDTFYLGARVLQGALQKGGTVYDGQEINLDGPSWDRMRRQLDKRLRDLPKNHPLRPHK